MMRNAELQIKVIQYFTKCVNHRGKMHTPGVCKASPAPAIWPSGSSLQAFRATYKGKAETYGVWTHRMTEILTKTLKLLVRPYKSFPTANVVMK